MKKQEQAVKKWSGAGARGLFRFACLFIVLTIPVFAEHLPVRIYTSADGLGSSFVDFLYHDSRGFLWACTRDGLSRFDGSRFVNYRIGEVNSPPGIENIYELRDGRYFISTTGGTYLYDPNLVVPSAPTEPRLTVEKVTDLRGQFFEDSRGNLWFATDGIFRVVENGGKFEFQKVEWDIPPNPSRNFAVYEINETADGSLWAFTSWGMARRLPDGHLVVYSFDRALYGGIGLVSMLAERNGRIWLTILNEIYVINPEPAAALAGAPAVTVKPLAPSSVITLEAEAAVPFPTAPGAIFQYTNPNFIASASVKRLWQTADGEIWISAENNLLQIAGSHLRLHPDTEGLPQTMNRMAEDGAGNLWIASNSGLARLDRHGLITYDDADGAISSRFFAVTENADGILYFGSNDSYINRFDGRRLLSVRPRIEPNATQFWTSRFILHDSNGDFWILTNGKLYRFAGVRDVSDLRNAVPARVYTSADGLKSDGMFQIYEDSKKDIWVSTRGTTPEKHGLARLRKDGDRFETVTETDGFPNETSPSAFAEDRSGNLWCGFYEGGAARFDGRRFTVFRANNGFPGIGLVSDMHLDSKGRLWISTSNSGLFRIDDPTAETPVFTPLTTLDGLSSNNIRTITEDRFGRIYVGTARGVDRISPDTGRVKHFSVNDGLAADFVIDSHCDRNGNLWFVTNNGLSRLTPQAEQTPSPPPVFLDGLRIAGTRQPVSELGDRQIDKNDLSYTENNLQIDYFGLDFRTGETLLYQYKLEGADEDWSAPTELRTVTFANLQPNSYRFLVRAVNSEGVFSTEPATVSFRILPPVWQRWWFILLAALLVALVIVLLYRYRTARLREINLALAETNRAEENLRRSKEERLAELETVRSRIATDLHDDIGASLTQIAVLSEVARAQSRDHGASESLRKISSVSNELVGTMSDIVWAINPSKDHLSDLTQRMRRFASDVLSARGIVFQFASPEDGGELTLGTNLRREVFLIFKESVNNVAKHSGAKQARIELKVAGGYLTLEIADDGKGFEIPADIDEPGSMIAGNGIFNLRKRAAEMQGGVEIVSGIGAGTVIRLRLPLENPGRS